MVRLGMPIESTLGAQLMLRYRTGLGEEHVTRLHLPLDIVLGIGLDTDERFYRPQGRDVFVGEAMRLGVSYFVFLPSAEITVGQRIMLIIV